MLSYRINNHIFFSRKRLKFAISAFLLLLTVIAVSNPKPVKKLRKQSSAAAQAQYPIRPVSIEARQSKAYATHDFGIVKDGKTPRHVFSFKNTSDKAIKILKTRIPCGCADIGMPSKILKPKETTKFNVTLKYKNHRGKITKHFYLFTDSKEFPIIKYSMTATIEPKPVSVCIVPSQITVAAYKPNEEREDKIKIENRGNKELQVNLRRYRSVVKAIGPSPLVIPPGATKEFKFKYKASDKEGAFSERIILMSNDPRKKLILVQLKGEVKK